MAIWRRLIKIKQTQKMILTHHSTTRREIFTPLFWRLLRIWSNRPRLIFWPFLVLVKIIRGFVHQEMSDWSHYFTAHRSFCLSLTLSAVITLVPLKACLHRSRIQMWFNYLWNFNWRGLPVGNAKVSKVIPSRSRTLSPTQTMLAACPHNTPAHILYNQHLL